MNTERALLHLCGGYGKRITIISNVLAGGIIVRIGRQETVSGRRYVITIGNNVTYANAIGSICPEYSLTDENSKYRIELPVKGNFSRFAVFVPKDTVWTKEE